MSNITENEYWNEITDLAKSIIEEVKEENPGINQDDLSNQISDRTSETIDGHQWIIYYAYNLDVINYSDNEDYMANNLGGLDETVKDNGFVGLCNAIAYWAMWADVSDKIQELL